VHRKDEFPVVGIGLLTPRLQAQNALFSAAVKLTLLKAMALIKIEPVGLTESEPAVQGIEA
jgi:hypothetical protein